jgi:hypothetical protein
MPEIASPNSNTNRDSTRHKLPAVYFERAFVVAGGLIRCRPRKRFRSPSAKFFHVGEMPITRVELLRSVADGAA